MTSKYKYSYVFTKHKHLLLLTSPLSQCKKQIIDKIGTYLEKYLTQKKIRI